ncbi:TrbI F-type domain-containing protein [Shewanella baltica]|uniref:TrbI F-type domain-containing protein n=1 Tax=Shewanella baltica TaxID=62322 RepID=UPI00217DA891|nr:TrbI F-type domain-containing protein [Shewanella baltica]MCS6237560.1 TrbI F-type domain-containing protein [Shewanella baltica]MCS6272137.1 TrbI F-type domain-containing protein [Shewanella baltica]
MEKTIIQSILWLVTLGVMITLWVTREPRVVEYDINETVASFHQSIGQSELSDEQREKEITRFTQTLDDVVREYALDNHVVVLVSPAVVSGAVNVTQEIQQSLLHTLQAQNKANRAQASEVTAK